MALSTMTATNDTLSQIRDYATDPRLDKDVKEFLRAFNLESIGLVRIALSSVVKGRFAPAWRAKYISKVYSPRLLGIIYFNLVLAQI